MSSFDECSSATATSAAAAASAGAGADTSQALSLSKKDKGRLKKLRRRAALKAGANSSAGVSGITTWSDSLELRSLLERQQQQQQQQDGDDIPLGPSILVANRPEYVQEQYFSPAQWQHTSGADHRNLILSLLFHDGSFANIGKKQMEPITKEGKRKRDDSCINTNEAAHASRNSDTSASRQSFVPPTIPSWARIHNPACANGLVVVEFAIESYLLDLLPSRRIVAESSSSNGIAAEGEGEISVLTQLLSIDGYQGRRAVPFTARMFQGERIRDSTNILMYTDATSTATSTSSFNQMQQDVDGKSDNSGVVDGAGGPSADTIEAMASLLQPFVLKRKSMRKERYPCRTLETKKRKKGTPPKKKRHKMTEAELAMESRESNRAEAQDIIATFESKLPAAIQNTFVEKNSSAAQGGNSLFAGAFSEQDAVKFVKCLEVGVLGQEEEYTNGEVFIKTFLMRSNDSTTSSTATAGISSALGNVSPSIFAIDCEMVETSASSRELARVTLIRFEPTEEDPNGYQIVLDLLVKPRKPVLDYKTQYSGITAQMLEPVTTRLEEVQIALVALIRADDYIIGHSLENDLRALCLVHERVVDTALLFRSDGGSRKHSLKHLSSVLLKRRIQAGCGTSGHCSEEDAAATLILAITRARLGPSFSIHDRPQPMNIIEEISAVRRKNRHKPKKGGASICETEAPIVLLGPDEWLRRHMRAERSSAHALSCESIASNSSDALVAWLTSQKRKANLLWANLVVSGHNVADLKRRTDKLMNDIVTRADSGTAILFAFQIGFERSLALTRQKKAASDSRSTLGWTTQQEENFRQAVDTCALSEALWLGAYK